VTPAASADRGLLDGLTDVLAPEHNESSEGGERGLLGGLLDATGEITEPLTGDLLDPVAETLNPVADDLDGMVSTVTIEETVSELTSPLQESLALTDAPLGETIASLLTPETPAGVPAASAPVVAPPAPGSLSPAGELLGEVLPMIGTSLGEPVAALTEPIEPVMVAVAEPLVGAPETPGLLPLATVEQALSPVLSSLIPIIEPAVRLTNAAVAPVFALVEPVVTPILRTLQPVLQPVAELLRPIGSPVVGVILPESPTVVNPQEPGEVAPPSPGQAPTIGLQTDAMVEVAALAASLTLHSPTVRVLSATEAIEQPTGPATRAIAGSKRAQALIEAWTAAVVHEQPVAYAAASESESGRTVMRAGAGSEDSDGSSLRIKAPAADLSQFAVLAFAACLVFFYASGSRSRSWLKCPVRPPI
jgi:hypothetical protein